MRRLLYFLEDRIPQDLRALVASYFDPAIYTHQLCFYSQSPEEIGAALEWAEAVLFAPGRHLPEELIARASNVKLMQLWSSGYDKFNLTDTRKHNIPVANNGGANAISVAEHTMLLLLATARRLPEAHSRATAGRWAGNSHGMDMVMLYQKVLAIVGMGNIGKEVARRARAFGMRVLYFDINRLDGEREQELGVQFCDMDQLLREADFLTLHLHLNASTRGLIGERQLGMLKKDCVLVNVSRAQLVDLAALTPRLAAGAMLGAGFDVFENEPTTGREEYLSLPNVVATPHIAGSTIDTYHMAMRNCMANIERVFSGQPPLWVVNQ